MKVLVKAAALYDYLNNMLSGLVGLILVLMMLLVSFDVIGRSVLNRSIPGTIEISEWAIMCIPFLGAAWLLRSDGHVKMDIVLNRLSPKTRAILNFATSILGATLCFTFTWYVAQNTWDDCITGYYHVSVLSLPRAPFSGIMTVGFFLLGIQFIRRSYYSRLEIVANSV